MTVMASDDSGWVAIWLFAVVIATAVIQVRLARRYKAALQTWARENKLELLEAKRRFFLFPWFAFFPPCNQSIFRIHVRTEEGREQSAYVRVGGYSGLGKRVELRWDKTG
jgi:hypothetical protein